MAGMGPPPKNPDQRARRNASPLMTKLPAEGRTGRAPAWPLEPDMATEVALKLARGDVRAFTGELADATTAKDQAAIRRKLNRAKQDVVKYQALKSALGKSEKKLWADLWKTPQACQWEKLGWTREVAQYVRHKVKAEGGSLDDAKEARQLSDRLGLNPLALLRLRWQIVETAAAAPAPTPRSRRNSSKYRNLKVVS